MLSCIPVQYIELISSGGSDARSSEIKALKARSRLGWRTFFHSHSNRSTLSHPARGWQVLRLVRLSKMLRLARIKRIMQKYEEKWCVYHTAVSCKLVMRDMSGTTRGNELAIPRRLQSIRDNCYLRPLTVFRVLHFAGTSTRT